MGTDFSPAQTNSCYRVLKNDDEDDPLDFGILPAQDPEAALSMVTDRLESLGKAHGRCASTRPPMKTLACSTLLRISLTVKCPLRR